MTKKEKILLIAILLGGILFSYVVGKLFAHIPHMDIGSSMGISTMIYIVSVIVILGVGHIKKGKVYNKYRDE